MTLASLLLLGIWWRFLLFKKSWSHYLQDSLLSLAQFIQWAIFRLVGTFAGRIVVEGTC